MKKIILLLLVCSFLRVYAADLKYCLKIDTSCDVCYVNWDSYDLPDEQQQCIMSMDPHYNLTQTELIKKDLVFNFSLSQKYVSMLIFTGDESRSWSIRIETSENKINIANGLQLKNLKFFTSINFSYNVSDGFQSSVIELENVENFTLDGRYFNQSSNNADTFIFALSSNLYLYNFNLLSNSTYNDYIRMNNNSNLTYIADDLNFNKLAYHNFILALGGTNNIYIKLKNLRIIKILGQMISFITLQSFSSEILSNLVLDIENDFSFEKYSVFTYYPNISFFQLYNCNTTISTGGDFRLDPETSGINLVLFKLTHKNLVDIKSARALNLTSESLTLFNKYSPEGEVAISMVADSISLNGSQGFSYRMDEQNSEFLNLTISSRSNLSVGYFDNFLVLYNSQFLLEGQNINFLLVNTLFSVVNSTGSVRSKNNINMTQRLTAAGGSAMILQENSSRLLFSSGKKIQMYYSATSYFIWQGSSCRLEFESEDSTNIENTHLQGVFIQQFQDNNTIKISSKQSFHFTSQFNETESSSVFFRNTGSDNSLQVYSEDDLGFSQFDKFTSEITLEDRIGYILQSEKEVQLSLTSAGGLITFYNLKSPGSIFYLEDQGASPRTRPSVKLQAHKSVIFFSITSLYPMFYLGNFQGDIEITSESGSVQFQEILSSGYMYSLNQETSVRIEALEQVLFSAITGTHTALLTSVFSLQSIFASVNISSKNLVNFTEIQPAKGSHSEFQNYPQTLITELDWKNQSFVVSSSKGVIFNRSLAQDDYYQRLPPPTSQINVEWNYLENRKFLPCFQYCQICSDAKTCSQCGKGRVLSQDKSRCVPNLKNQPRTNNFILFD